MRICLVASARVLAPARPGNPLYVQLYGLANGLVALGHQVHVIALPARGSGTEAYHACEIGGWRLPGSNAFSRAVNEVSFGLAARLALRRLARQEDIDVVHFDATVPAFLSLLLTARGGPPVVFWHGGPVPGADQDRVFPEEWHESGLTTAVALRLQSYVMRRATRVIALSSFLRNALVRNLALRESSLVVIPPGVDSGAFRPGVDDAGTRESFGIPEGAPVVTCVAKIAPYKNQLALVRAMPRVVERHPEARLMLVGGVFSREYQAEIVKAVRSLSLERNVVLTGPVVNSSLPQLHAISDVFVLPSLAEGLPGVLVEAMSCGKACVASSIPQNREVAKNGDEVLFVDPRDSPAIAEAINRLLGDPGLREAMGQKARQTALEHFDWKVVAGRIAGVYQEAINASRRQRP